MKYFLDGINEEKLRLRDKAYWLPDNSILINFKNRFILKSEPPYTTLTLVNEMNYDEWANLNVSIDGKKISFYIVNHIYLVNTDWG